MTVDFSDLIRFAAELKAAGRQVVSEAPKVVKKGALNIKNDARANLAGSRSNAWLIIAMSFDITEGDVTEAEIGPDQAISGLGLGREFGSSNTGPHPFLIPAFEAEEPRTVKAAEDLVAKAFKQ